ncbi:hypothetical protein LWC34_54190 [Kibdelosporangium philippinense]|uniref:Uncharacterized protein n=1 Tax=Kibdelosporangium philippinense TaxID=211113 RepID=A0ABS8ZVU7_9PSEU|nr:hypothetical protein [Kibdelosporangium philippinense]MCE7011709.1 hypothetical protein [Kibdelosporangium philippinense]
MPIDDPTTATPSEIDEELARLDIEHANAQDALDRLTARVKRLVNDGMTEYATELRPRIEQARQTIAECEAAARPLESEFERRGGWTRAWLVDNSGGHVHRSTACRTCFPSTRFAWLTQLSGHDEAEIVEQAGRAACTECYPSAPVDVRNRPSRIKTPEQLAREAEKAERAKAKAAKAITAPDGTPLRTKGYGQIDTEFTARRSYADALAYARYLTRASIAHHRDTIAEYQEDARLILAALAAKHGRTEDDLRAELAPKVEARWKREYK